MQDYLDKPDTLYKYRDWTNAYQKRILTHNEAYFAFSKEFNDPYDTYLPYTYNDEELSEENLFKKVYDIHKEIFRQNRMTENELIGQCYKQIEDRQGTLKWLKEVYENSKNSLDYGILSLTTKRDNLLMWSHYANSHKGFCVGFDTTILESASSGYLKKIIYADEFYQIGLFDELKEFDKLFLIKSGHWQYEDEYRIVRRGVPNKVFNFPNEAISEIIIGLQMPDNIIQEVLEIAFKKFTKANVYFCKLNPNHFKIDLHMLNK